MMKTSLPLLVCFAQIFLVSYVIGSNTIKLAIVNHDAKHEDGQCKYVDTCSLRNLSCRYITYLWQQPIRETYYNDLTSTVRALRAAQLDASALVYFNENFTDAFVAKMALDDQCTFLESCSLRNRSCRYIAYLWQQPIRETYYNDLDSTVRALRAAQLDASALVYLNENFTDAFVAKMALGHDADSETVDSGQIHVWLSKEEQTQTIKQLLQAAFDHFTQDIMSACGFTRDDGRFTFNNAFQYRYV